MTSNNQLTKETVNANLEEFDLLREVAEAASDMKLGEHNAEFRQLNGGPIVLRERLLNAVSKWEDWSVANAPE